MANSNTIIPNDNRDYNLIDNFASLALVNAHTPAYPSTATWIEKSAFADTMQCNASGYVEGVASSSTVTDYYSSSIAMYSDMYIYTEALYSVSGMHLKIYTHLKDSSIAPTETGFEGYEIRLRFLSDRISTRVRLADGSGGFDEINDDNGNSESVIGTIDPTTVTKVPLLINVKGDKLTITADGESRSYTLTSYLSNTVWGWMLSNTVTSKLYNIRVW